MHCPGNVAILPQTRLIYSSLPQAVNQSVPALDICVADYIVRSTSKAAFEALKEAQTLSVSDDSIHNSMYLFALSVFKAHQDFSIFNHKDVQALVFCKDKISAMTALAPIMNRGIGTFGWTTWSEGNPFFESDSFAHLFCARRENVSKEAECRTGMQANISFEDEKLRGKFVAASLRNRASDSFNFANTMANATVHHVNQLVQRVPRLNEVTLNLVGLKRSIKPLVSDSTPSTGTTLPIAGLVAAVVLAFS